MSKAFDKIAEGLKEALAVAQQQTTTARFHTPAEVDVRTLRRGLKLTQQQFASQYGFSLAQIRDWEQGRSHPSGALRTYLLVINKAPEMVVSLLQENAPPKAA